VQAYFLDRSRYKGSYAQIKDQINQLFTSDAGRTAPVWFVGMWDTVASVGAPLLSREITATPTIVGKRFVHVRQALALDEYRRSFNPRPYFIQAGYPYADHQQSIQQQWFSGAHVDVGGGALNHQAGLSQQALLWMVQESALCGLRLRAEVLGAQGQPEPGRLTDFLAGRAVPAVHQAADTVVNDQLYRFPWWALGGMCVRNPLFPQHLVGQPEVTALAPIESPTVHAHALQFPAHTLWRTPRSPVGLCLAVLLALVFWVIAGALLLPASSLQGTTWWQQLVSALQSLPSVASAHWQFAQWQLCWLMQGQPPSQALGALSHPAGAVLVDFGLIAAYGYLLARASSWAFARIARLRRVAQSAPVWLNRLGMAAGLAVAGDIAENLLTWALLLAAPNPFAPGVEWLLGALMSLAALAKWLGFTGSAVLVGWACSLRLSLKKQAF
ncbi:MAG: DUF2235 domain-containing protein, partial [Burkholderiaceae bacterium]